MDDEQVRSLLAGRDTLLADAAERGRAYLASISQRRVAPDPQAVAQLGRFEEALSEGGVDATETLALLDEIGSPATVASSGGRYFGFVVGGSLPIATAVSWIVSAWDQNGALRAMSPLAARLDEVAIGWLVDLFGLPETTTGGFVSGATMANATCLAAARDAVLTEAGFDAATDGLVGAPEVRVVVGGERHTTLGMALGLVGLGRERAVRLEVDDEGAVRETGLPALSAPAIVCLQAGNVNSGASDPFAPLVEWAHAAGAWVHVDGAFGLWAAASPRLVQRVEGIGAADSWATDAHKWLNTPYDCGIALVRDGAALRRSMAADASYLVVEEGYEPMSYTPQSSQRARGVEVWATLRTLGREGVAALVERSCALARRFADGVSRGGLEVLNDVVLNQVLVACSDDAATEAMIAAVQADGTCWCGPTSWHGRRAMRVSVSCWQTTTSDVDASVSAVVAAGAI